MFNDMLYNEGMRKGEPRNLPYAGLPNRLRRLRIEKGYTLKSLAEALQVTPQAIHQAEVKGNGINRRKWYQLADLLDIDPRELEKPDIFSGEYQVST